MSLKYFLVLFIVAIDLTSFSQDNCCKSECSRPSFIGEHNFFCDLDSLNAFETIYFFNDSTFSYSHTHDWIDYVLSSSGKYYTTNDTLVLNSEKGDKRTIATNMKLRFIEAKDVELYNSRYVFCNGSGKYLLLFSNDNKAPFEFRENLTDPMLH